MRVVACFVARIRVIRILEENVGGVFAVSRCAVEKGGGVSLVECAQRLVSCGGSGPFG